jgi:hypothetical protein
MNFDPVHTPILITCRDRLAPLIDLVGWLERAGHERIILVDNDSSFPPLLEYFTQTPHQVIELGANLGHFSVWEGDVLDAISHSGPFVVTDSDVVPDAGCPRDAVERFADLLFRYGDIGKVGFGLRIDDLPPTYEFRQEVLDWESQFWLDEVEPSVFRAAIDTTFALYRPSTPKGTFAALRTGAPYVARHIGWYSDSRRLTAEEEYYRAHAKRSVSTWDVGEIPADIQEAIAERRQHQETTSLIAELPGLSVWADEPPPTEKHHGGARRGGPWHGWTEDDPDRELCEFVAAFVQASRPATILEIGVHNGFMTRRIHRELGPGQRQHCIEPDQHRRRDLGRLPFFQHPDIELSPDDSPPDSLVGEADLLLLRHSGPDIQGQLDRWTMLSTDQSCLVLYGADSGDGALTAASATAQRLIEASMALIFIPSPVGAYVATKGQGRRASIAALGDWLEAEVAARGQAEADLAALRASRSYRWLQPVRRMHSSMSVRSLRTQVPPTTASGHQDS